MRNPVNRSRAALAGLALLTAVGLCGAVAQGVAQQRLDEAVARLRALLGPDVALTYDAATADPVTNRVTLTGVLLKDPTTEGRIERLVLDALAPGGAGVGRAEATNIRITGPEGRALTVQNLLIAGLVLPADGAPFDPEALRLDQLRITAVTLAGPDASGRLGNLEIAEVGGPRATTVSFNDFAVSVPGQMVDDVRVARFFINGVRIDQAIAAVTRGEIEQVPPGRSELELAGVSVRSGATELLGLPRLAGWSDDTPGSPGSKTTQMWTEGLVMRTGDFLGTWLQQLGYDQLAVDFNFDGDIAQQTGSYHVRRMGLSGRDTGRINIAFALEGLTATTMALGIPPTDARLASFALSYSDASLLGRIVRAEARERGQTEQAVVERWTRDVRAALRAPGPRAQQAADQLVAFLRQPGTLSIVANPTVPVSMEETQRLGRRGPGPLVDRLNVTVTAR